MLITTSATLPVPRNTTRDLHHSGRVMNFLQFFFFFLTSTVSPTKTKQKKAGERNVIASRCFSSQGEQEPVRTYKIVRVQLLLPSPHLSLSFSPPFSTLLMIILWKKKKKKSLRTTVEVSEFTPSR